jgi:hypothetical protein
MPQHRHAVRPQRRSFLRLLNFIAVPTNDSSPPLWPEATRFVGAADDRPPDAIPGYPERNP